MEVTVREGRRADAAAIAQVRVTSWRAAYDGLVPDPVLAAMDVEREAMVRADRWTRDHRHGAVELLAESGGEVVGWASVGPSRSAELPDGGELYAIYAVPRSWSRGVGHALLTAAEEWLRTAGFTSAFLWVLEGNERAAVFYEAHGWREDGVSRDEAFPATAFRPAHVLRERRRVRILA
jgi:GNAT superfamily N-acetyltransferase